MDQSLIYSGLNTTRAKMIIALQNRDLAEIERLSHISARWLLRLRQSLAAR